MKPEPLIQCGSNLSTKKNAHFAIVPGPVAEQRPDLRSCPLLAGLLLWRYGQMDRNSSGRNRVLNRPWSFALRLHRCGNDSKRHPGCKTNLLVRAVCLPGCSQCSENLYPCINSTASTAYQNPPPSLPDTELLESFSIVSMLDVFMIIVLESC